MLKKILFAAALCAASTAQAQIRAEHPRFCVMSVGPAQMMFSALQENQTNEIFCQHVPTLGPTMIILDAKSNELRDMNIEVRVIRNVGQKDWRDDLDANTVAMLPPKKYLEMRGTKSFMHDFKGEGDYFALVRATSDDGAKEYVGQYDFSVGETYETSLATALLAATMGFAGIMMWRRSGSGQKKSSPPGHAKPESRPSHLPT